MKKILKITVALLVSISVLFINKATVIRAATTVNNEIELQSAINNGETEVLIESSFNITRTINITTNITIKGQGNTLTAQAQPIEMFSIIGANVVFENLNLDANRQSKALSVVEQGIRPSNVQFVNGSLKNGISWIEGTSNVKHYSDGGAIYARRSTVSLNGTILENNIGQRPAVPPRTEIMNAHGGAIFGYYATINLENVTAINNASGEESGGGVIYADHTEVTINNSTFHENHAERTGIIDNKGGVVAVHSGVLTSNGNIYNIDKKFNIGGAIYLYGSKATVSSDKFEANNLGDGYGISGGAIGSAESELMIRDSTFKVLGNSKVTHAGGMIDIIGSGKFELKNSVLEGAGSYWQSPSASTFGGAIAFETGSTATALIENTTIKNVTSNHTGGE